MYRRARERVRKPKSLHVNPWSKVRLRRCDEERRLAAPLNSARGFWATGVEAVSGVSSSKN
jgi:hypothetical protein